jgi:hypothetical protein
MEVLKNILKESWEYYLEIKQKIEKELKSFPKGSIKERNISNKKYFYLQQRLGKKVIHKYLGKNKPYELIQQIKERKNLLKELKKVNEALKILKKTER